MLYLAAQFSWFLLAAFGLGFVMGWISHDGGRLQLVGRTVLYTAGAWALVGALSWFQVLNGVPATKAFASYSAYSYLSEYALTGGDALQPLLPKP